MYISLASILLYLIITRVDISYTVQQICHHMHAPTNEYIRALNHIIRYLQGTLSLDLHMYKSHINRITSCTDANWGGCSNTRRSTSSHHIFLSDNLISQSSKKQPTLSRSRADAKHRGVINVFSNSCQIRNITKVELFVIM